MGNYLMKLASWKKVMKFVTSALMGFVTPAFIAEINGAL